jgi:hypothetical protein
METNLIPTEKTIEARNYLTQAESLKANVMAMVVNNETEKAKANEMLSGRLKPLVRAMEDKRKIYSTTLRRMATAWDAEWKPGMAMVQGLIDHLDKQIIAYIRKEEEAARQLQEEANRIAAEAEAKRQEDLRKIEAERAKAEEEGKPLPEIAVEAEPVVADIAPAVSRTIRSSNGTSSIRKIPTPVIFDESLLPRKYLVPNVPLINHDVKAGIEVPGARLDMVDSLATRRW